MKKLMSILGAVLFVFALTLSSCGDDAKKAVAHGEDKHECTHACDKHECKKGCDKFVAPVVVEEVEEVVVEEVVVEEVAK